MTLPVPEIGVANAKALLRLKMRVALLVTALTSRVPVVPLLPICRAPADIVTALGNAARPVVLLLVPVRVRVPVPTLIRTAAPVRLPAKVVLEFREPTVYRPA